MKFLYIFIVLIIIDSKQLEEKQRCILFHILFAFALTFHSSCARHWSADEISKLLEMQWKVGEILGYLLFSLGGVNAAVGEVRLSYHCLKSCCAFDNIFIQVMSIQTNLKLISTLHASQVCFRIIGILLFWNVFKNLSDFLSQ